MKHTILYVGLDVDDTRYPGSALNKHTGEVIDFHCRPTLKGLVVQLHTRRTAKQIHTPQAVFHLSQEGEP